MKAWVDEFDDLDLEERKDLLHVAVFLADGTRLDLACPARNAADELRQFGQVVQELAARHGMTADALIRQLPARLFGDVVVAERTKGRWRGDGPRETE